MIEKVGGEFELICDVCEESADEFFDEFYDAVEYKKDNGWRSRKDAKGNWEDVCPECQEKKNDN
jgi:hypothetical protein